MKKNDTSAVYRLIVIGGGAASLCGRSRRPARPAFPKKHRGLILERKPEPGKKLMITGSGQCNITHSGSIKNFPAHYHEAGKKIRTLLYAHSNEQVVSTFASMGLRTFVREDGKIFPESLSAREVRDILRRHCEKNGFSIQTDLMCTGLIPLGNAEEKDSSSLSSRSKPAPIAGSGVAAARWKVICGRREYLAENVLVAAGGSFPCRETGSDGSFLRVLTELNFPISPVAPALVPVFIQRYPFRELSGHFLRRRFSQRIRPRGQKKRRAPRFSAPHARRAFRAMHHRQQPADRDRRPAENQLDFRFFNGSAFARADRDRREVKSFRLPPRSAGSQGSGNSASPEVPGSSAASLRTGSGAAGRPDRQKKMAVVSADTDRGYFLRQRKRRFCLGDGYPGRSLSGRSRSQDDGIKTTSRTLVRRRNSGCRRRYRRL